MINEDINKIIAIAQKAGDAILKYYLKNDSLVYEKEDKSLVTSADLAAHKIIAFELQKLTPEIPLLSEEGQDISYVIRKNWERFWMVDPLDGTKEFIKKNGEFTVNIALIENAQPTLGVIYAPALNLFYYGEKTQGSFKIDEKGNTLVLKRAGLSGDLRALRIVGSRSHTNVEFEKYIEDLEKKYESVMVKSVGSSLKFCLVAENEADCYPRLAPTMEWDTAAGHAIAKFSGFEIVSLKDREELSYNKESLLNDDFIVF